MTISIDRRQEKLAAAQARHARQVAALMESRRSDPARPPARHEHARFGFGDGGPELRFVDQRTFGGMGWSDLGPHGIPTTIAHIAPDPFEPGYDEAAVVRRLKSRDSAVKRALLDLEAA